MALSFESAWTKTFVIGLVIKDGRCLATVARIAHHLGHIICISISIRLDVILTKFAYNKNISIIFD
jgi:hypothetical protein